jgi:hypothetical protein
VDLAKIGEVWEVTVGVDNLKSGICEINKRLSGGWVLISARGMDRNTSLYILGKPREKPKPTEKEGLTIGQVFGDDRAQPISDTNRIDPESRRAMIRDGEDEPWQGCEGRNEPPGQ